MSLNIGGKMATVATACVRWMNFSQHMLGTYQKVYETELYTDVTLILADGQRLPACKLVLSMASAFFENIFACAVPSMELITVLIPDVGVTIMKQVLHFMYTGDVHIGARDMADFFEVCRFLRLRGLNTVGGNMDGIRISGSNIINNEALYCEELDSGLVAADLGTDLEGHVDAGETTAIGKSASTQEDENVEHLLEEAILTDELTETMEQADKQLVSGEALNQYYSVMEVEMLNPTCVVDNAKMLDEGTRIESVVEPFVETVPSFVTDNDGLKSDDDHDEDGRETPEKQDKTDDYATRLDAAVTAVVSGGVSYRVASTSYGIPKTVLWRKTIKMPRCKMERMELTHTRKQAIEALKAGEKLLNISRRFDIPLSTLHRDKIRLYSAGVLPETVKLKQRDRAADFKQRIEAAARNCLSGLMSQSEASRFYKLPKTTIWRRIKSFKTPEGDNSDGEIKTLVSLGGIEQEEDHEQHALSESETDETGDFTLV